MSYQFTCTRCGLDLDDAEAYVSHLCRDDQEPDEQLEEPCS